MSFISSIEPLNGGNYDSWREKLEMTLALSEIDLALTSPCPTRPEDLVRGENKIEAAWTARQREHAPFVMKYDLDKAKWDQSNRKCLMVIKSSIVEAIRGAIPESTTAIEYLRKVESQFAGSSKAYASTLIKMLVTEKYNGGGIREYILRMSNMASKLKPMNMELPIEFLVHLIFASLPREYDYFEVNYNLHLEKWDIEKLIAMCV
ncbi:uncharacterized protein LOC112898302 [Panicum hallii]|jgi:hypothetical protein|uniref:uncharacterized protein LOC112898302 n=1 Tax=Panicum hallii TaxID=206008 RepID=UPI000DF4CC64|nr:uncharacterized protein LOC112898302 [Panicum hallii]